MLSRGMATNCLQTIKKIGGGIVHHYILIPQQLGEEWSVSELSAGCMSLSLFLRACYAFLGP